HLGEAGRDVQVLRAPLMPVMGLLVVAAWLALTLWAASPYGRYLDHGSWSDIGLAAAICACAASGRGTTAWPAVRRRLVADDRGNRCCRPTCRCCAASSGSLLHGRIGTASSF